jgi:UDP-glucuronate decarboxylase
MANIYVTGVAGFLGSHIANHHLAKGDHVWGMDNFSSSNCTSKHITALRQEKRFSFAMGDISEGLYMRGYKTSVKIDVVYNFACPASPPVYQHMPVETMMTCVLGTKKALDFAREHNAILVHASTSEVYGDPEFSPQSETYKGNVNSYGPRSCYDEGKRAAEALCFDYLHTYNTDARLVRIFNTYGPHLDMLDGRVVSNFIRQALKGEPLTIYGDGSQTRSFCYVDDLIRGITTLAALPENPKTPINVGNPDEFTIDELAWLVINKIRSPNGLDPADMYVINKSLPQDDPTQRKPDTTLAKSILKWRPEVSLDKGLDKTIEYFRKLV